MLSEKSMSNTADKNHTQTEKLRWLRAAIEKGMKDLREGRTEDGPTVMARIRQNLINLKVKERKEVGNEYPGDIT